MNRGQSQGAVGFAKERRYFVSGKMSFLAEALIVRVKNPPNSESLRGQIGGEF
jgi:hypothetical protein